MAVSLSVISGRGSSYIHHDLFFFPIQCIFPVSVPICSCPQSSATYVFYRYAVYPKHWKWQWHLIMHYNLYLFIFCYPCSVKIQIPYPFFRYLSFYRSCRIDGCSLFNEYAVCPFLWPAGIYFFLFFVFLYIGCISIPSDFFSHSLCHRLDLPLPVH